MPFIFITFNFLLIIKESYSFLPYPRAFFTIEKIIKKIIFVDETINYILYICKQDNKGLPYPKSIIIRGMLYGGDTLWRNITMKRKPKMHNEQEFNLDNVYQEDERQLDNLDDSSFDMRYK